MLLEENLSWCLTKLGYLNLECCSLNWILQLLEVYSTLICHRVEDIVVLDRALIHTENQIDPVMKVLGDVLRFKCLPILAEEFSRCLSPSWQLDVINTFPI